MAAPNNGSPGDARRGLSSPRPKGRENQRNTLCRNVVQFGYCKYAKDGSCPFNHETPKLADQSDNHRKRFNVDSPSFTPLLANANLATVGGRSATMSPNVANAAIFTPKAGSVGTATPPVHQKDISAEWANHEFQDFVPQGFDGNQLMNNNASNALLNPYDPFTGASSMTGLTGGSNQAQINPYAQGTGTMGVGAGAFYQGASAFAQPLQYHLYASLGPYKEDLLDYQRTVHDFFLPKNLREDLQQKAEAIHQILPTSTLPAHLEDYHSLVPLDTNNQKNTTLFSYPTWVYKATKGSNGKLYALRRLEGFRLTSERATNAIKSWKRIKNSGVVSVHDPFTTREFGDSSLIIVTDYHPCSKTLAEKHFNTFPRPQHGRTIASHVPEQVLWGYIVQIASALKSIHSAGLAARLITPSKILVTSENRIRLNACGILDATTFDTPRPLAELQQDDLTQLGRLILSIATNNVNAATNVSKSMEFLSRSYSERLRECVHFLLQPANSTSLQSPTTPGAGNKDVDALLMGISSQMASVLDSTFHAEDTLRSELMSELENGRLVRLLAKLNYINERPEFNHSVAWGETGERYYLKLFRDYVWHQVDAQGNPVVDLAHMLTCMNKLDAGVDEKIVLTSRDEQNCFVVSYRELKRGIESAFNDLLKASRRT